MKCVAIASGFLVLAVSGCGSSTDGGGSGSISGAGGASAGSAGAVNGGADAMGGRPTVGTPGFPSGPVFSCFGNGCPLGKCDNSMFFAPTLCSAVYTSDVGPSSSYCNAGENSDYCLQISGDSGPRYAVTCVSGNATVLMCTSGCGNSSTSPSTCR